MCDDAFGWWFRLLLNLTSGAMFGWAYGKLRSAERTRREVLEWRAMVEANLTRSAELFRKLVSLSGDDDDASVPPPLH